jgi:hypothetical protein
VSCHNCPHRGQPARATLSSDPRTTAAPEPSPGPFCIYQPCAAMYRFMRSTARNRLTRARACHRSPCLRWFKRRARSTTFAVQWIKGENTVASPQQILGHPTAAITMRYMAYAPENYFAEDAAKLSDPILGEVCREVTLGPYRRSTVAAPVTNNCLNFCLTKQDAAMVLRR